MHHGFNLFRGTNIGTANVKAAFCCSNSLVSCLHVDTKNRFSHSSSTPATLASAPKEDSLRADSPTVHTYFLTARNILDCFNAVVPFFFFFFYKRLSE